MEKALALIEAGQIGTVTLFGMGGVFIALILLYLFTTLLGKSNRNTNVKNPEPTKPLQPELSAVEQEESSDTELAAAVAVACFLAQEKSRTHLQHPGFRKLGESWRMVGRLEQLQAFEKTKK